jgi:methylthioribose-1-phosphate isomerase
MVTVEWKDDRVRFIDQTKLPREEVYVETADYERVGEAIRKLEIRGAPAIGVAAAFAVLLPVVNKLYSSTGEMKRDFSIAVDHLSRTRPTAVNLFTALKRMRSVADDSATSSVDVLRDALLWEALSIQREDIEACRNIGEFGATLLRPGFSVLTHCNAGALATAGEGTALSVITRGAKEKKVVRVFVDETRPLFQGARLTAWELVKQGIPVVLITDSTAGTVLRRKMVDAVIVGADRIAANGDAANKIGTYPLAVLADLHGIPFYVAAPTSTIDHSTASGGEITIEERGSTEVTHVNGVRIAAEGVEVFAPAFDVTPNELISAIVTEKGILRPPYVASIARMKERPGKKG